MAAGVADDVAQRYGVVAPAEVVVGEDGGGEPAQAAQLGVEHPPVGVCRSSAHGARNPKGSRERSTRARTPSAAPACRARSRAAWWQPGARNASEEMKAIPCGASVRASSHQARARSSGPRRNAVGDDVVEPAPVAAVAQVGLLQPHGVQPEVRRRPQAELRRYEVEPDRLEPGRCAAIATRLIPSADPTSSSARGRAGPARSPWRTPRTASRSGCVCRTASPGYGNV